MRRAWWVALLLALGAAGCGESRFVPIHGTITVDGQPGKNLFIQFEPLAEGKNLYPGLGSVGRTDDKGAYSLLSVPDKHPGAVVAKHMVRIYIDGGTNDEELTLRGQPLQNAKRPKQLPERYNEQSKLTFEVSRTGSRDASFALTTK